MELRLRPTVRDVDGARQAEIDALDLAIIEAHDGDICDVEPVVDPDAWAAAADEWDDVDL